MYFTRRQTLSLLASVPLAGLGIAACGGPSTASPNSGNSLTLKAGQISKSIAYFVFYVAGKQGFFTQQGLNMQGLNATTGTFPVLGTGAKVAAAVESGSIDIGGGVTTDAFDMSIVDSQARIIGSLVNGYYIDVIVGKKLQQQANLTTSTPLADKVKALVGKKIGITGPGSGTEALLIYLFRQQGLNARKDAVLVNLGSDSTAVLGALQSGRVDALSFFIPLGQTVEAKGAGTILISPTRGDIPELVGDVLGVFYTRQSVIDAKPKAVEAFIRAIAQAEDFIHKEQDKTFALLQKYTKLDTTTTRAVLNAMMPVIAPNPQIDQHGYEVASKFHVQAGLISAAPAYNNIVAVDTINRAIQGMS